MAREVSSKNIDGIADLVVIAPIREGFISAYENVTYATRLRIVAEALNRIRVSAREHEAQVPFSDVTERILTLLDFRIGVLDKKLFSLEQIDRDDGFALKSRRYLYLTATFDTAWEPYMRLIWDPLGPFLDLIFCNCEGYVTAGDNSCEAFLDWVRANQMDSAIFYATTGNTIRDNIYQGKIDRLLREVRVVDPASLKPGENPEMARLAARELAILQETMPNPEAEAEGVRSDPRNGFKVNELALEVLTVLFRLVDYYPPEWLFQPGGDGTAPQLTEGKYLARVAHSILQGWNDGVLKGPGAAPYAEPLEWYRTARAKLATGKAPNEVDRPATPDPLFERSQVPAGLLISPGTADRPVLQGALLLLTITATDAARAYLAHFPVQYEAAEPQVPADGLIRTVAFSQEGLKRIGLPREVLDAFPTEFREGMAARSGLIGDLRDNHPRRWVPPRRNWPPATGYRPPVDINEVDVVIQLRHAPASPDERPEMLEEIRRIADAAAASGLQLVAYEPLQRVPGMQPGTFTDHFGFSDGVSQPEIVEPTPDELFEKREDETKIWNNKVRLGDVLLGYRNERDDTAPVDPPTTMRELRYAAAPKRTMRDLTRNGSFLVVRKLEQHVAAFRTALEREAARLRSEGFAITADEIAWQIIGRRRDGSPLLGDAAGPNDFTYDNDPHGSRCPLASHIRRTNPRDFTHGRPAPRLLRRGMSYGPPIAAAADDAERGLMFMCYQSSLAEQFETVQRWINGGNSTGIASAQNDPLLGVAPKQGPRLFQFEWQGRVARIEMPEDFVSLRWGIYLFVPSRDGLAELTKVRSDEEKFGNVPDLAEFRENSGRETIERVAQLPPDVSQVEWKRLLEDLDAKDPAELSLTPDVWSAIRWYQGGALRLEYRDAANKLVDFREPDRRPTVIVAGAKQVDYVLANWKIYSVEEQLHRLEGTSGSIYVSQQPDDRYYENAELNGKYNYAAEAYATNEILIGHDEATGFAVGHGAGSVLLGVARQRALAVSVTPPLDYFKLELRRQYLMPALGLVCTAWFGIPGPPEGMDDPQALRDIMENGGWDWKTATGPADEALRKARCPGDCLSPSRHAFYPQPTDSIAAYAHDHGPAIREAGQRFIDKYFGSGQAPPGSVSAAMFEKIADKEVLARNLIGIMMGAMPPMDGNLRGILAEWLNERTLWRHQAAYLRKREAGLPPYQAAREALWIPMTRAMCKRPAPDLLYRIAIQDDTIRLGGRGSAHRVKVKKGDMVIVAQVGASQQSLFKNPDRAGTVEAVFGGKRYTAAQGDSYEGKKAPRRTPPVHACPGKDMAMGAMMGILAALFEAGRIQALPASLIVKIMDWPPQPG